MKLLTMMLFAPTVRCRLLTALLGVVLACPAVADLSDAAARGKRLFHEGVSHSGVDIPALVGQASVEVSATTLPCQSCHGDDGLGRPEGGVNPSDITWNRLSKPYGATSASGREFPPYDAETLARAVRTGVDSGGTPLSKAMPRYALSDEDVADLLAYLKMIDSERDPGVLADRVLIGTVLPRGAVGSLGDIVSKVLSAYFNDINTAGGIYGRNLELIVGSADSPAGLMNRGRQLIDEMNVFALLGAMTAGAEREFAELVEDRKVPLVTPFSQFRLGDEELPTYHFALLSGIVEQMRALVSFAHSRDRGATATSTLAIVTGSDVAHKTIARDLQRYARRSGWQEVLRLEFAVGADGTPAGLIDRLRDAGAGELVYIGGEAQLLTLLKGASERQWVPNVYVSGVLTGRSLFAVPAAFDNRLFGAFPTIPTDYTQAGRAEFNAFHQRHELGRQYLAAQLSAYSACKVLVEALKRSGRSVSRSKVVDQLEGLYDFDTGLTPKISFGPNRRVGALGAHIVAVDLENKAFADAQWVVVTR